jgi:hypothetical protein
VRTPVDFLGEVSDSQVFGYSVCRDEYYGESGVVRWV